MKQSITVGTKVAYSKRFLQSISEVTGAMPFARGKVTRLLRLGDTVIAEVDWDRPEIPVRVITDNLIPVDKIPFECN